MRFLNPREKGSHEKLAQPLLALEMWTREEVVHLLNGGVREG
jgi:hypothetical protein